MNGPTMAEGLGRAAAVGPFFSVRTDGGELRDDGFVPLAEIYGNDRNNGNDGNNGSHGAMGALSRRVDRVADQLRTPETRVAASLTHQGLAGRLWSLALAPAVLDGRVPDLAPDGLWWHPGRSAPGELRLPAPTPLPRTTPGRLAGQLRTAVLHGHLVPLLRATRAVTPVAEGLLWGNAASALVGTVRVLHTWCLDRGLTEAAHRSVALAASLLDDPLLHGSGTLDRRGPSFTRRSCCLYYRVPGGGLCGDCSLRTVGSTRRTAR